jgi:hypothetical protein
METRDARVLSNLMDETVSSCYYDVYQSNETSYSGDICNKSVMFYKELCKAKAMSLESCQSDYFKKYLERMEGGGAEPVD